MGDRAFRIKLIAAFAALYVIWGSTYLGILYAIETIPPFLMAGARFLIAGVMLYTFALARGAPAPSRKQWRSAAIVGGLLLLVGNGAVVWAELTVPTGVVSLIVATVPIWMVLFEWIRTRGVRPRNVVFAGLGLGLVGIALLIGPAAVGDGPFPVAGALVVMVGSLGWAAGSIYSRGADLPKEPLLTTGMQMLAGGALLVVFGTLLGEVRQLDVGAISGRSWGGLIYLITFGSLIGYTSYIWLLRVTTPARVSTYAYVNPVVAVALGWAFAGETITGRILLAAAVIIAAVALIVSGQPRQTGPDAANAPLVRRARGSQRHGSVDRVA
jgi:drug/metabolite transporter (DMT)-like permease